MMAEPVIAGGHRRPLRPCAGRRISGHQPPAGLDPAGAEARRARADRRRRRRAVDLFLPRRDRAQHPRFSRPVLAAGRRSSRSTATTARPQPILAAANARHRPGARALHQEPLDRPRHRRERPQLVSRARRGRPGALRRRAGAGEPRGRRAAEAAGGAVPRLASQRAAGGRADPPQHPLRQVRRAEIPRRRACQGRAGAAALGREPARPRRRFPRAAAAARRRPATAQRVLDQHGEALRSARGARPSFRPPPRAGADWTGFVAHDRTCCAGSRMAGRSRTGAALVRAASRAHARGCDDAPRRSPAARADRARLSLARALPDRAHARPAGCDQRPSRAAAARRGLSDPLHHPFGQGPGMEVGLRAQRRRWLHAVRSRRRHRRPRSRRSAGCSMSR